MTVPDHISHLDENDPLRHFRDRFVVADDGLIYMDGNSLGRLPKAALANLNQAAARQWGAGLVESWEEWIDLPQRAGALIEPLIGASPGTTTLADSTSVNLYKLAAAALDAFPGRRVIVTDRDNFPTDRYVLEGLARSRGAEVRYLDADPVAGPSSADVAATLDGEVALVSFSLVAYRTGALADIAAINELARGVGAMTLWDLSHAVGSVPIDLEGTGTDLAVGCTYKYLCGGPGAPAFLYVRPALQGALRPPIWGWFAHADQFSFGEQFDPARNIERYLVGTPPILSIAAATAGIEIVAEAGIEAIRAKSVCATELMIELSDEWLAPLGVELGSPRRPSERGSHVAFNHPDGFAISTHLRRHHRVVADFRAPTTVRMAVAPTSTSYAEVWTAMAALRETVAGGDYEEPEPAAVT